MQYIYIDKGRNDEIEIDQNFDFHFHIRENTVFMFSTFSMHGESPYLHVRTYSQYIFDRNYDITSAVMPTKIGL